MSGLTVTPHPSDKVLDILDGWYQHALHVGAGEGEQTKLLAFNSAHVTAVEPWQPMFDKLVPNLPPNAVAEQTACTSRAGSVTLFTSEDGLVAGPGFGWWPLKEKRVPGVPVDGLVFNYDYPPDLLWITCNGMERDVLAGARQTLTAEDPWCSTVVVELFNAGWEADIRRLMPGWKLTPHYYGHLRQSSHEYRHHFWMVGRRK